jgi:sulfatase modifying factor 1
VTRTTAGRRFALALFLALRSWIALACALSVAAGDPRPPHRWAILIGVDDYTHLQDLKFCAADQLALRNQLLQAGFAHDQVVLLHDRAENNALRPFKSNIQRELEQVLALVEKGDLVVVGFSGHGVHLDGQSYFCPLDARLDEPRTSMVSILSLYEQLERCPASLKLVLVDACRNDPRPSGRRAPREPETTSAFVGTLQRPPKGILVLSSCDSGQMSCEEPEFGHGVFMHYLLSGLGGGADADGDGRVSLLELYRYASKETRHFVHRRYYALQTPTLRGEITDEVLDFDLHAHDAGRLIFTNSLGMQLVRIPAGEFQMGTAEDPQALSERFGLNEELLGGETRAHRVRIGRPFFLGRHEVTVGQFRAFVEATGYRTEAEINSLGGAGWDTASRTFRADPNFNWRHWGAPQRQNHPVVNVSWNDAVAFCTWLSRKEATIYRLPTEAEWEYACRAGTNTYWHHGDAVEDLTEIANVADAALAQQATDLKWPLSASDGYAFPAPIGSFRPNAFGLYDMHGNVTEWCFDWFSASSYSATATVDPLGPPSGETRVLRGGSWLFDPAWSRSASRGRLPAEFRYVDIGFRVAREIDEQ